MNKNNWIVRRNNKSKTISKPFQRLETEYEIKENEKKNEDIILRGSKRKKKVDITKYTL